MAFGIIAIIEKGKHSPSVFDRENSDTFAVESSLSGVAKTVGAEKELVYRRSFDVPSSWKGKKYFCISEQSTGKLMYG